MTIKHRYRSAFGALALGAGLLATTGCAETALVGQLDDSELQDPQVIPFAALGVDREINDLIFANLGEFDEFGLGGTNDLIVPGAAGGTAERKAIGDFRERGMNGTLEQTHEAAWSAYKIIDLQLNNLDPEFVERSPIAARSYVNAGFMERILGDIFCETIFQYGPFGGFNLATLGEFEESRGNVGGNDRSTALSKDSVFARAAFDFERAIEIAEAAIAANTPIPSEDPEYFDPSRVIITAYGGLAQARAALASLGVDPAANWAAAADAAANVPTDFQELWETTDQLANIGRNNQEWLIMWTDNETSLWNDTINGEIWGSAVGRHAEPGDARLELFKCQEFEVKSGPEDQVFSRGNVKNRPEALAECMAPFEDGRADLEIVVVPRWLDGTFNVRFAPVPAMEGTEMRLIEAEAAMFAGDLGLFTTKINEVRNFYGASEVSQPAMVGEFEFPNEVDDARSILDREYLLESYGTFRRLFHLHRWNHPFITENKTVLPLYRDLLEEAGAGFQRESCFPIPSNECSLNPEFDCPVL